MMMMENAEYQSAFPALPSLGKVKCEKMLRNKHNSVSGLHGGHERDPAGVPVAHLPTLSCHESAFPATKTLLVTHAESGSASISSLP